LYDKDYYISQNLKFARKWASPEAFFQHRFTKASDVWSYAVLLWELFESGKSKHLMIVAVGRRPHHPLVLLSLSLFCLSSVSSIQQSRNDGGTYERRTLGKAIEMSGRAIRVDAPMLDSRAATSALSDDLFASLATYFTNSERRPHNSRRNAEYARKL
jgi:hypothetical protein